MKRLILAACLAAACPSGVKALEGDIEANDRFSSVVRISGQDTRSCTGVVLDRRFVFTAAHCLVDSDGKLKRIAIRFKDVHGTERTVLSREVFVPTRFQIDWPEQQRVEKEARNAGIPVDTLAHPVVTRSASMDIGIIIPDDDVNVTQEARIAIDAPRLERMTAAKPTERTFRSIILGYGYHGCSGEYENRECKLDSQLRSAVTGVTPAIYDIGDGQKSIVLLLGLMKDGEPSSPARRGDSGGPVFLENRTSGQLLLVGTIATASKTGGAAVSLFMNRSFIQAVRTGTTYIEAMAETAASAIAIAHVRGPPSRIAVGWAIADSTTDAEKRALAECRKKAGASCKVVAQYRRGCRFTAIGKGGGRIGMVVEASREEALAKCREKGYICGKIVSKCIP